MTLEQTQRRRFFSSTAIATLSTKLDYSLSLLPENWQLRLHASGLEFQMYQLKKSFCS